MELLLQKTYRTDQEDVGFNMRQAACSFVAYGVKVVATLLLGRNADL